MKKIKDILLIMLIVSLLFVTSCRKSIDNELVLAMSQFEVSVDETGKQVTKAKDAKVWIAHPDENWMVQQIINPDSNVAHKGLIGDLDRDGKNELYIAGGQKATLKRYDFYDGQWHSKMIWNPDFVRVRDIEIGDIDDDGENEMVAGTHDQGVVEVFDYKNGEFIGTEVYRKKDTYIHEVEIGDLDNDGLNEFFADPTEPNVMPGKPQLGSIVMFKWNGVNYDVRIIEDIKDTHTKEIAIGDVDNDGNNELIAALFGIGDDKGASPQDIAKGAVEIKITMPVYIKMYKIVNGEIKSEVIGEIEGEFKARSMALGDINNDGKNELVIGTNTKGLQVMYKENDKWKRYVLDKELIGNIHSMFIADFDNDGKNEVLANSDNMEIIKMYKWVGNGWESKIVLKTPPGDWGWGMDFGNVDND